MNKLNCPNCGAPISPENNKCEYCGTSYFDLSSLDLDKNEPFYLKIKINNIIITQLVQVDFNEITMENNTVSIVGGKNQNIATYSIGESMQTNLIFRAVQDPNKKCLYTIQYK